MPFDESFGQDSGQVDAPTLPAGAGSPGFRRSMSASSPAWMSRMARSEARLVGFATGVDDF